MHTLVRLTFLLAAFALAAPAQAGDVASATVGGDVYAAGSSVDLRDPSPRDVFMAGFSATLSQQAAGDVHASGFSVDVGAPVGGDLYALGFSIDVASRVSEDVTAAGANITLTREATVGGNARLLGGSVEVKAPVSGSLVASAGTLTVESAIAGDARLTSGKLSFGPDAHVGGTLTYSAPEPIEIAPSVAPAERIRFVKLEAPQVVDGIRNATDHPMHWLWPSWASITFGTVLALAFLLVVAAAALAFAPAATGRLRADSLTQPFRSILLGMLGLATLFGLVPVSAMTIIGIPLVPVVVLFIVVAWILGYLLGAFAVSWRMAEAFGRTPVGLGAALIALAIGLVVLALLNFIPVLGWLINLVVLLFGLGGFVLSGARALAVTPATARRGPQPAAPPAPPAPAPASDAGGTSSDDARERDLARARGPAEKTGAQEAAHQHRRRRKIVMARSNAMKTKLRFLPLLTGLAIAAGPAAAQELSYGEAEFMNSCAVCHGENGEGFGPLAELLTVKPADLTRLEARNGGEFPYWSVFTTIDGRHVVPGHGDRDMPVWGQQFLEEDSKEFGALGGEMTTQARIHALVGYIETLQQR